MLKKEQHEMENSRDSLSWDNIFIFTYSKNNSYYLANTPFKVNLYAQTITITRHLTSKQRRPAEALCAHEDTASRNQWPGVTARPAFLQSETSLPLTPFLMSGPHININVYLIRSTNPPHF